MTEERKSIYIETTIPSYATARLSSDPVVAGRQVLTKFFWEHERHKYDLYISQDVVDECSRGDYQAAQKRLGFLAGIAELLRSKQLDDIANTYKDLLEIPDEAKIDSYHIAHCVVAKIDYLLSWNFRHLSIASYEKLKYYNDQHELWAPLLVTPEYFTTI